MDSRASRLLWLLVLTVCAAAGLWLWLCLCRFPLSSWNDVRLEPSFMLARGFPVYPAHDNGTVTTWLYGPLPILLLLPATLAPTAAAALMSGGCLNLIFTAGVIVVVCAAWPGPLGWRERLLAAAACIALWPASNFLYIQADNYAVACGLLSLLVLARGQGPTETGRAWLAALLAAAAVMCKQTSLGVMLAQCLWIGWNSGTRAAIGQAIRGGTALAALLAGAMAWFGSTELWFNLVQIPGHLPWTQETARRLLDLGPLLMVHIGIPFGVLVVARKQIWKSGAPLLLPALTWACVLPAGLAGILTSGGTLNSLQGMLYLLPPLLLTALAKAPTPRCMHLYASTFAVLIIAVISLRIIQSPQRPMQPALNHIRQGAIIASQLKGKIWFPWNPLITVYSEGHFYHVEDGLYVRFITGYPLTYAQARAHLPPDWRVTALRGDLSGWGISLNIPPIPNQVIRAGMWTLHMQNMPPPQP